MYALFDLDGDSDLILNNKIVENYIYNGQFLVHFKDKQSIKNFEYDFFNNGIYDSKIQEQMEIITRYAIISLMLGEEDRYENGNYSIKIFKNLNINEY